MAIAVWLHMLIMHACTVYCVLCTDVECKHMWHAGLVATSRGTQVVNIDRLLRPSISPHATLREATCVTDFMQDSPVVKTFLF